MDEQSLSRGLAFFSVGLGLAELLAPRQVARLAGVDSRHARLIQFCGVREIGAGMGILQNKPSAFLWSRVAGDVMDLAFLGAAWRDENSNRRRLSAAISTVAAVTALDIVASVLRSRDGVDPSWRYHHEDRGGIERGDPVALRAHVDNAWARSQPETVYERAEILAASQTGE